MNLYCKGCFASTVTMYSDADFMSVACQYFDSPSCCKVRRHSQSTVNLHCSPRTNPENAVAPWEFPRSLTRHLENSEVEISTLRSFSDLEKFRWAPWALWENLVTTLRAPFSRAQRSSESQLKCNDTYAVKSLLFVIVLDSLGNPNRPLQKLSSALRK